MWILSNGWHHSSMCHWRKQYYNCPIFLGQRSFLLLLFLLIFPLSLSTFHTRHLKLNPVTIPLVSALCINVLCT